MMKFTSHVHRTQVFGSCPGICGTQELLCLYIVERNLQFGYLKSEIKTKISVKGLLENNVLNINKKDRYL